MKCLKKFFKTWAIKPWTNLKKKFYGIKITFKF